MKCLANLNWTSSSIQLNKRPSFNPVAGSTLHVINYFYVDVSPAINLKKSNI